MKKKISDVMTKKVDLANKDTPLRDVAKMMKKDDCGSVPVQENDKLVGMVTDRDIVLRAVAAGKDPNKLTARDVMTKDIFYCYDDQTTEDVTKNMADIAVRRLPVVNRQKRLVGIVSLGDLSQGNKSDAVTGEAYEKICETRSSRGKRVA